MPRIVIPDPTTVADGPDLDGWREAQRRLRIATGTDVIFRIVSAPVYDTDVAIDPESGEPYDPTTVPLSGGDITSITLRVSPVFRPIRPHVADEVQNSAIGSMRNDTVALLVDETDYPSIETARDFIYNGVVFTITATTPDGLHTTDHYIVFGEPQ